MVDSTASTSALHHQANELLALIEALNYSGSRLEDDFWETKLSRAIRALLADADSTLLEQLLDYLSVTSQPELYDILASFIEGQAESTCLTHNQQKYDVLLVTAPITTWTRYQLPSGDINHTQHEQLLELIKKVAGSSAKVAVLGQLLSFDQLPATYAQTYALCKQLGHLALDAKPAVLELDQHDDGINLLADVKFIVSAIVVPVGQAIFAWQEQEHPLDALELFQQHWPAQAQAILSGLFAGCQTTYLPPDGYFYNNRVSDKQMRPLAVKAAIQWLAMTTNSDPSQIFATVVRCGEHETDEFRIGLSIDSNPDILYGCVWPIFNKEETDISSPHYQDNPLLIQQLLTEQGIESIHFLAGVFEPEFCDDCHAPSFPTAKGELKHPYLPEEIADFIPTSLH